MRAEPLALCCLALLGACTSTPRYDPNTISQTTTERPVEGRPTFGEPIAIPGQTTVLVPFSVETHKSLFQDNDPYTRGGMLAGGMTNSVRYDTWASAGHGTRWHNVVFRDLANGEAWPLLTQRGIISEYQMLMLPQQQIQPNVYEPPLSRAVVFIAVVEDSNSDGLLNDLDARVAILTDADGRRPRIVTPGDAQVWGARFNSDLDTIFFQVATDTSGDGEFTFDDVAMPYAIAADGRGIAEPVLSDATRRAVESILTDAPEGADAAKRAEGPAATP